MNNFDEYRRCGMSTVAVNLLWDVRAMRTWAHTSRDRKRLETYVRRRATKIIAGEY